MGKLGGDLRADWHRIES